MEVKYRKNEGDRLRRKKLNNTTSCPTLAPSFSTSATVTTLAPSSSSSIVVKKDNTALQLPLLPRSSSRRSKRKKVTKSLPPPVVVATSNNLFPIVTNAADSVLNPPNDSKAEPVVTRIPHDSVSYIIIASCTFIQF